MQYSSTSHLIAEIERYLALVDAYRAHGCEPHWQPEPGARKRRRAAVRPTTHALFEPTERRTR